MTDTREWYESNKIWLIKWFENRLLFPEQEYSKWPDYSQVFRVDNYVTERQKRIAKEEFPDYITLKNRQEFIDSLLLSCVFSEGAIIREPDGGEFHLMKGFVEQVGRKPIAEDKVQLLGVAEKIDDYAFWGVYYLEILG